MSSSHRSSRSFRRVGAMVAVGAFGLAACVGGDDEDEAAATTAAATTSPDTTTATTTATTATSTTTATSSPATTTTDASDATTSEDDEDRVIISGLDEVPQECVDAVAEFLRRIEPIVSEIDWDAATLSDFESISDQLDDESDILDDPGAACDDFDFAGDEESLQALIEFAEDEAPGVVGWLEFIAQLSADPTGDDDAADGPQTCDEAIAYIEELAGAGTPLTSIPVSELGPITQAFNVITTDCDPETAAEFFERVDIADFMF